MFNRLIGLLQDLLLVLVAIILWPLTLAFVAWVVAGVISQHRKEQEWQYNDNKERDTK